MRTIAIAVLLPALLSGCMTAQPTATPMVGGIWMRADGKSGKDDPALAAQFQTDKASCEVLGGVDRTCMARKGYILVQESEAEATAAKLKAAQQGTL